MQPVAESRPSLNGPDLLLLRPTPVFTPDQMARYTPESIFARQTALFDPAKALERLHDPDLQGRAVIGIDIGGGKFRSQVYRIDNGLSPINDDSPFTMEAGNADEGKYITYLDFLSTAGMPVGLSIAGPMEGTRIIALPNLQLLKMYMDLNYDSDFANTFSGVHHAVANDAVAVTMGGSVAALDRLPNTRNIIVGINGGGWGGAVLKDGQVWAAEMGHTQADELILPKEDEEKYGSACGVNGATYTCLEKMAASGAGVERLWKIITSGEQLSGKQIAERLQYADSVALNLYDKSAIGTAMGLLGFAQTFDLKEDAEGTAYVLHGGIFNVPQFGERVERILERNLGYKPHVIYTKEVSPTQNIGLEGAAIAALMAA